MIKALGYARVSTMSQHNERQVNKIKAICKDKGYNLIKIYEEKVSGLEEVRDQLTKLLNHLKKEQIDIVVIDELSRLGRTEEVIHTIETIHSYNTSFYSNKEQIITDVSNPTGIQSANLLIGIISSINKFELTTYSYRTKEGRNKAVLNGGALGSQNICYGYTKDKQKKLVVNPDEAIVIKKIFDLYMEGYGTTKIAKYLNDNNIPTRTFKIISEKKNKKDYKFRLSWVDGTIYSMLKNSIYKGVRVYNGDAYESEAYKIIDPEIWDEVQIRLKKNYNKTGNRNSSFNYIISRHKLFCGICGRAYFAHKREQKGDIVSKDNRYLCLSKRDTTKSSKPCDNVGISIDKVERLVQEVIFYIFKEKLLSVLDDKEITENIIQLKNELKAIEQDYQKIDKEESNILEWVGDSRFSKEKINKRLDDITIKRKKLTSSMKAVKKRIIEFQKTKNNLLDIEKLRTSYKVGEKIPKEIVDKIITKIVITKKDEYPIAFNKVKGDKVVEIKILAGNQTNVFLISQRTNEIYYLNNEVGFFPMDKFFSDEYPRKAFDFITGA